MSEENIHYNQTGSVGAVGSNLPLLTQVQLAGSGHAMEQVFLHSHFTDEKNIALREAR